MPICYRGTFQSTGMQKCQLSGCEDSSWTARRFLYQTNFCAVTLFTVFHVLERKKTKVISLHVAHVLCHQPKFTTLKRQENGHAINSRIKDGELSTAPLTV